MVGAKFGRRLRDFVMIRRSAARRKREEKEPVLSALDLTNPL